MGFPCTYVGESRNSLIVSILPCRFSLTRPSLFDRA